MAKKILGLFVLLAFSCGIFAALPAAFAMNKTDLIYKIAKTTKLPRRDGDTLTIEWQYASTKSLEGTKVKINLYRNGQFVRTLAENVPIGQNGRGSWNGTLDNFFSSPDWRAGGNENKADDYQIEIVGMNDSNIRAMGERFSWDWGNK